eukprot:CAMPEP_0170510132 /NCGR_PEP_ID=MMETSP0208-20121228/65601_1 /TAXON_ID=197538 /ORGANISM="Strombidium inclinatum, Strain S3" /LENGTH=188 /DNA_ID=CAMNT_0010793567 /DNA_START=800 /DNA_END=1366 /DNA_ORIENTATION=+
MDWHFRLLGCNDSPPDQRASAGSKVHDHHLLVAGIEHGLVFRFVGLQVAHFDVLRPKATLGLEEAAMLLLVLERFEEGAFVHVVLDGVVLEGLVGGTLQVVSQRLEGRLQVVAVRKLLLFFAVEFVVVLENVLADVNEVVVKVVSRAAGLDYHRRLDFHELFYHLLVALQHHGEALLILDEEACGHDD